VEHEPARGVTVIDEVRTSRLLLARLSERDLGELCRMHRDARVMATLGGVRLDADTRKFARQLIAHWDTHGFGYWSIREAGTGRFVGRGGLRHVTIEGRPEVEVAYALLPQYWGRGLGTELAKEAVRVGFEVLERPDLVSFTLPTNAASRRVMEKAGFVYERDVRYAGLPHVLYRLSASAWRGG
jgi:ribosomal-protein-alanine N-acetyltransferase